MCTAIVFTGTQINIVKYCCEAVLRHSQGISCPHSTVSQLKPPFKSIITANCPAVSNYANDIIKQDEVKQLIKELRSFRFTVSLNTYSVDFFGLQVPQFDSSTC